MSSLVGNKPNQVPTNGDLGTMAFQDASNVLAGTISTTGNVGVGTASPSAKLDVSSSTALAARITGPANVYQDITDGTGTLRLQLLSNSPYVTSIGSYPFVFGTNNTERMRIDASGNLGVGTSSPGTKLDVNGTFRTYQSVAAGYATTTIENTDSTGYNQLYFNVGTGGAGGRATISYAPSLFMQIGPAANDTTTPIKFVTNNATERMRIDSAGNVGVGTSSPGKLLDVGGVYRVATSASAADVTGKADNTGALNLYGGSAYNAGAGIVITGSANATPNVITFTRGTFTESMRINSTGQVGIGTGGTITSGTTLEVNGISKTNLGVFSGTLSSYTSSTGALYAYYSSGGVLGSYSDNSGTKSTFSIDGSVIQLRTTGSANLYIASSGGVSIGNTTDAGAGNLSVSGTVKTQGYTVATLPTGSIGMKAYVTDAVAPTFLGTLTGGGAVKCPVFYNGTAWVAG